VPTSRYRPEAPPDYSHRFHAGNVGDVWKHCALVEVLRHAAGAARRVAYLDTHAGEGRYTLAPTGEWTEGIGRVWELPAPPDSDAVARYANLCRSLVPGDTRPSAYPGSPLFARRVLGDGAPLVLWERDADACERLTATLGGDPAARVVRADGLAGLGAALDAAEADADAVVVLVDPPYSQKADWTTTADAVLAAAERSRRACLVLWYPVKSLTRPNAMMARFEAAGVSATIAELITTPLAHQRQRLNGSGVLLVRPPEGTLPALAAAAPVLGGGCATRPGVWSARLLSW
jgi:23S rRNA (adenine2030-N6)-methyltransferase